MHMSPATYDSVKVSEQTHSPFFSLIAIENVVSILTQNQNHYLRGTRSVPSFVFRVSNPIIAGKRWGDPTTDRIAYNSYE